MKDFPARDFLLDTPAAQKLYHEAAEGMPIFDYHCHLSPKEIYEDKPFADLCEAWLGKNGAGDHYKWRLMRANGVPEELITGNGAPRAKFDAFVATLQNAVGNPIYHWAHLELAAFFGIREPLTEKSADRVWETANEKLKTLTPRKMILQSNVRALCTTDDPVDDLAYHKLIAEDKSFPVKVLPTFRPDKALALETEGFAVYASKLEEAVGHELPDYASYVDALIERLDFFRSCGCVVADHGLGSIPFAPAQSSDLDRVYKARRAGQRVSTEDIEGVKTDLLIKLGRAYAERGMAQQYHVSPTRNNNAKAFAKLGADSGFDAISDEPFLANLSRLFNAIEQAGGMPKTILYSLNPNYDEMLCALGYCFAGDIPGKIQLGTAWWFNDHIDGMTRQLTSLSAVGLLGQFIGMLTDSRSFLSYPRHDYFRRILCRYLGGLVERGEYPEDYENLSRIVRGVCFENACRYFGVET